MTLQGFSKASPLRGKSNPLDKAVLCSWGRAFPCNPNITFVFKSNIEHENNRPLIFGVMGGKMNAPINWNLAKEYDFMKKLIAFVLALVCVVSFFGCNNKTIPNLNPNNETGWTVLHGIYVKTELGHDVLVVEPENSEEMYIFMTFTEECDVPNDLQTGDKIAIKIVVVEKTDGVNTTQVFELAQYGDSPVPVDSEVLSEIEALSQKLANADATEKVS